MWDACSPAPGPAGISGMELRIIWDVDADDTYDVRRGRLHGSSLIALRTLKGHGLLQLEPHGRIDVGPDTLVVMEDKCIRSYRTLNDVWRFWWFGFTTSGALPFPLHKVLRVPASRRDLADFRSTFAALRRERFAQRCVATATFSLLLCRWLAGRRGEQTRAAHREAVERVVDQMHEKLSDGWTVADMAKAAHLSVRRFRQVFREATGLAPKTFYDRLRVNMGERLLRLGTYNVTEVSDRLGFSSPFHFSKAFRQHAGRPPSQVN